MRKRQLGNIRGLWLKLQPGLEPRAFWLQGHSFCITRSGSSQAPYRLCSETSYRSGLCIVLCQLPWRVQHFGERLPCSYMLHHHLQRVPPAGNSKQGPTSSLFTVCDHLGTFLLFLPTCIIFNFLLAFSVTNHLAVQMTTLCALFYV